jgi:glycosyltransferase involved in cell wall biosynthesis
MNIKLSIIVPCYNELQNLPTLFNEFSKVITRKDIELIIVNNGSNDGSKELINKLLPKYPFARVEHVPVNKGYGFGIISGLEVAKGSFLGWTHADLQTDPGDVIKALNIIEVENNDNIYVKGDRKGRPFFDQLFTTGMSIFESLFMKKMLWDINAQPNIFHQSFYKKWKNKAPNDFSLDLFVLYMAQHLKLEIKRFNVVFPERVHGVSSWNTSWPEKWKFIKRTLSFSIGLKKELKHDSIYRP